MLGLTPDNAPSTVNQPDDRRTGGKKIRLCSAPQKEEMGKRRGWIRTKPQIIPPPHRKALVAPLHIDIRAL